MKLEIVSLSSFFENFDEAAVTITQVPKGEYSTPFADVIMLLKIIVCSRARRLLEIGSFRGYTALLFAQHTSDEARIVTVDRFADHGEAYRNSPYAAKIKRRVGEMSDSLFVDDKPGEYDLIFIDADHHLPGVKRDSELSFPLIAENGFVVWHDYANWGYFNGENGVPEYLAELADTGLPIARIAGTDLAIHSPAWNPDGEDRLKYELAVERYKSEKGTGAWNSELIRG